MNNTTNTRKGLMERQTQKSLSDVINTHKIIVESPMCGYGGFSLISDSILQRVKERGAKDYDLLLSNSERTDSILQWAKKLGKIGATTQSLSKSEQEGMLANFRQRAGLHWEWDDQNSTTVLRSHN